jgi:UDP-N-acetylmuramoylalanine-D-glutamate ligase
MATCKTSINHRRPGEGSGSEDPQDRYPNTGISILIVGGGVAGLYLALECVRQGHNPTVIESKLDDDDAQPDGKSQQVVIITLVFKRHFTDYCE